MLLYDTGHIPGAFKVDWHADLNDPVVRDYVSREQFQELLRARNIDDSTTVIFYGDKNNWWAAYAFWVFQLFGFTNARILDGGRVKWEQEGRPMDTDVSQSSSAARTTRPRRASDEPIRAFMSTYARHVDAKGKLVDVRSPDEYSGKKLHMPEYPQEGAMRGGHIPGAKSVPWARAANPDGTFKPATSSARSTSRSRVYRRPTTSSRIAASANARAIPGSFCATCSAMTRFVTTTAAGPNGETPFARQSKNKNLHI